ncbi:MAG: DUF2141 domain-containing protein [Bacteroidales bacterium]|nr:DUF2141 domain-containing protein [Bacteroidales bacterium]
MNKRLIIIMGCLFFTLADLDAQTLVVDICNIRSASGQVQLSFYRNSKSFENDKPFLTRNYSKKHLREGKLRISINLEPGIWGVAMMDDENANGKMDYKALGIPKEGFGFSNYTKTIIRRPGFNEFKFPLGDDGARVIIRVNYL